MYGTSIFMSEGIKPFSCCSTYLKVFKKFEFSCATWNFPFKGKS